MSQLATAVRSFVRDEEGATAVEYGLILVAIAAVIIAVVVSLGGKVLAVFVDADKRYP